MTRIWAHIYYFKRRITSSLDMSWTSKEICKIRAPKQWHPQTCSWCLITRSDEEDSPGIALSININPNFTRLGITWSHPNAVLRTWIKGQKYCLRYWFLFLCNNKHLSSEALMIVKEAWTYCLNEGILQYMDIIRTLFFQFLWCTYRVSVAW